MYLLRSKIKVCSSWNDGEAKKKPKGYELRRRENEIASPASSPFRVLGQETSSLSLRRSRRTKTPGVTSKFWHLVGRVKPSNDFYRLPSDPVHDVLACCAFQLQFHRFSVWKKCILGQRPSCNWSYVPQDLFEVALSVDCVPFDEIKILLLMYVDMCLSVLQLKAFLAAPKWEKIKRNGKLDFKNLINLGKYVMGQKYSSIFIFHFHSGRQKQVRRKTMKWSSFLFSQKCENPESYLFVSFTR